MGKRRDGYEPEREGVYELVTRPVRVGWRQNCVVCGTRFTSKKPAESCSEACKQRRKRQRQGA